MLQMTVLLGQSNDLSLLGYSGLLYTPSAYTADWGDVYIGFTHYDKNAAFTFEAGENMERSFIANIGFLPFAEFTLRLTKPYDAKDENYGIGDRSISGRVQLLKEKQNIPAVLIGVNDLGTESSYFNTNYIVLSKTKEFKGFTFNGNMGYGFKINEANRHYLQGLFGGLQASWKSITALAEYDAAQWNVGLGYTYKNLFFVKTALIDTRYPSVNIGVQFNIR